MEGETTAYYVANADQAARWGRIPEVREVEILLVSIVRPLARVRFASGRVAWVPFADLASSRELLSDKLQLLERIYLEINTTKERQ